MNEKIEDSIMEVALFLAFPGQRLTRNSPTKFVRAMGQASVLLLFPWTLFAMFVFALIGVGIVCWIAIEGWWRDV